MQEVAARCLKEHGTGRMTSSSEQDVACALLCTKHQGCHGMPVKQQHQTIPDVFTSKFAPTEFEQRNDVSALSRVSSCPLPDTPQQEAPQLMLPKLRTGMACSTGSPAAAGEAAAAGSGQCPGWFFNCRGCGCMTAYERRLATADVPFCRRCQLMLDDATPEMQGKMVDTLLYVHSAWTQAGL
eukprot:GHRQ01002652.1.p2 GENE.GHRQ01002652.1~~GHRQ01002652.1.p2  ORF type:complete len:183 (+),score=42.56 GHRQ01002652.1:350-898(+)